MITIVLCKEQELGRNRLMVHSTYDPDRDRILCIHCGELCVTHQMVQIFRDAEEMNRAISGGYNE